MNQSKLLKTFKLELNKVYCIDAHEGLKQLPNNSVDSIVTDPPYGLSFMGKKWDYDVPKVEIWKECLRVLKPGGHLLAFAGTRTQHRMAVNIEDAGFEVRDIIFWNYASGFPKSLNIYKQVIKNIEQQLSEQGAKEINWK
jgi:site-specific DNA-methyltransferase (adenine-specific)